VLLGSRNLLGAHSQLTPWRIRQYQMHSLLTPGSATGTESVALPSYVPHTTIVCSRSSHQHVNNCIEVFTIAVLVRMLCQPSAACVARVSVHGPLFLRKRIFRLSLTLLLDKNKLMLWFRRLRRNSRFEVQKQFLKRPSSASGAKRAEPPRFLFVHSRGARLPVRRTGQHTRDASGSQSHHSSPTRFARVGICIFK
jgi:hypothetical protein